MIRRAVVGDGPAITAFVMPRMHDHVLQPIDPERGLAEVTATVAAGQAFVAEREGMIIGSVGYETGSLWYSSAVAMFDKWMCAPGNPMAAGRLIRALEVEAKALGLPFFAGVSGNLGNQRVFEKRYALCGAMYRKD